MDEDAIVGSAGGGTYEYEYGYGYGDGDGDGDGDGVEAGNDVGIAPDVDHDAGGTTGMVSHEGTSDQIVAHLLEKCIAGGGNRDVSRALDPLRTALDSVQLWLSEHLPKLGRADFRELFGAVMYRGGSVDWSDVIGPGGRGLCHPFPVFEEDDVKEVCGPLSGNALLYGKEVSDVSAFVLHCTALHVDHRVDLSLTLSKRLVTGYSVRLREGYSFVDGDIIERRADGDCEFAFPGVKKDVVECSLSLRLSEVRAKVTALAKSRADKVTRMLQSALAIETFASPDPKAQSCVVCLVSALVSVYRSQMSGCGGGCAWPGEDGGCGWSGGDRRADGADFPVPTDSRRGGGAQSPPRGSNGTSDVVVKTSTAIDNTALAGRKRSTAASAAAARMASGARSDRKKRRVSEDREDDAGGNRDPSVSSLSRLSTVHRNGLNVFTFHLASEVSASTINCLERLVTSIEQVQYFDDLATVVSQFNAVVSRIGVGEQSSGVFVKCLDHYRKHLAGSRMCLTSEKAAMHQLKHVRWNGGIMSAPLNGGMVDAIRTRFIMNDNSVCAEFLQRLQVGNLLTAPPAQKKSVHK